MVEKSPLVLVNGGFSQLPPGDSLQGVEAGQLTAVSGLQGGGNLDLGSVTVSVKVSSEASGLYVSSAGLGVDGAAQATADAALASGNAALIIVNEALSSGLYAESTATSALASGNAALSNAVNYTPSTVLSLEAASVIQVGNPVGIDDTGRVQAVVSGAPTFNSATNFIGIAQSSVSSGSSLDVLVPKSVDFNQVGLTTGYFYYLDPLASGFTTASGQPTAWNGELSWRPVGKAISSSGLLLLRDL